MGRSISYSKTSALIFSLFFVLSGFSAVIPTFEDVEAVEAGGARGEEPTRGEEKIW